MLVGKGCGVAVSGTSVLGEVTVTIVEWMEGGGILHFGTIQ